MIDGPQQMWKKGGTRRSWRRWLRVMLVGVVVLRAVSSRKSGMADCSAGQGRFVFKSSEHLMPFSGFIFSTPMSCSGGHAER